MANLTIRNIPDKIFKKVKNLSEIERRSLNSEMLVLIEKGLEVENRNKIKNTKKITKEAQIEGWEKLSGKWKRLN